MLKIGVVGGGIAGLYCAWKLGTKHKVTVFETLNKPGGRIETVPLGGFNAECGPMRFELGTQPLIADLIEKLELETKAFSSTRAEPSEFPKFLLIPSEMSQEQRDKLPENCSIADAAMFSHHTTALDLLKYGVYRLLTEDYSKTLVQVVIEKDASGLTAIERLADSFKTDEDYNDIRGRRKIGRHFLWELGFWNALARVLSPGALSKLNNMGTFYHLLPENPSASEWSIFWIRLFKPSPQCDLTTIKTGVYSMVDALCAKLAAMPNVEIKPGLTVSEINCGATPGKLLLRIEAGSRETKHQQVFEGFDHVIFALPAKPLQFLMRPFPKRIREQLIAVIPFPLLKVFVAIRDPWWDENNRPKAQEGASHLATREIHYDDFTEGVNRQGLILFYMDRPAFIYWAPFIITPHTEAQQDEKELLRQEIVRQLAFIWPKPEGMSDLSHRDMIEAHIISFAIRDWSHPPFMAACHAWAPRTNVPAALNALKAFNLTNSPRFENVHVCGEAYSDYQGFIEGSLRSAENVIRSIRE